MKNQNQCLNMIKLKEQDETYTSRIPKPKKRLIYYNYFAEASMASAPQTAVVPHKIN